MDPGYQGAAPAAQISAREGLQEGGEPCPSPFKGLLSLSCSTSLLTPHVITGFQFLRLAQTLRHYGYLRFDACVADFPEKDCPVVVSAGNSELSLQLRLPGQQLREGSFRVTRMRCWRVTSSVSWEGSGGGLWDGGLASLELEVGQGGRQTAQNELSLITLPLPGATAQWRHKQPRPGPG